MARAFRVDKKMPLLPAFQRSSEPEYGTLHSKRAFAGVIKVKDLEMGDYPGFSERAWYNLQGSLEEVDRRV